MLVLTVNLSVKQDKQAAVLENFIPLQAASRQEPGCLMYIVHRRIEDPTQFFIYEQYTGQAALDAHRKSAHFLKYAPRIDECCVAQQRWLYEPIANNEDGKELIAD